ncbi:MAG TPA: ABC transporter permease [Segeticoccus sp.]|uniref:ABC transporter permease n=1 Tax=Segeticoccus sp. TaxID=2706531 RepID=UPI002D7F9D4F|nr:ABC transporter permease [Segeticoccus sp.]HET8599545.1 ABC transporter permease [Segeticoccus sp.]
MTNPTDGALLEKVAEDSRPQIRRVSKGTITLRRYLRNRPAVLGLVIFLLLVLFAAFGSFIAKFPYDQQDFLNLSTGPSAEHWFGTDVAGGDVFALTIRGLQRSLMIGVISSVGMTVIAAFVGTAVAYFEGWTERIGMWLLDMLLVIPSFLVLAVLVKNSSGSNGWFMLTLALMGFGWIPYARILRSIALSLREREYVQAAKFMGERDLTIITRHMIPNLGSILIIHTVLGVGYSITAETGLSFLGFGVKPPDISLGVLIHNGAGSVLTAPWIMAIPSVFLIVLLLSMTLIGDGLRDALDPASSSGGKA